MRLGAEVQMALEHRADEVAVAVAALGENAFPNIRLALGVLAGVRMAAIDHERWLQSRFAKRLLGLRDIGRIVVRAVAATAQDDMAVGISRRFDDARGAVLIDAEKTVLGAGRGHRIDCGLETSVRGIFESDRHRESARHFAVGLGFRGARADGRPGDQVRCVLRNDGIEKFRCGRQAEFEDVQKQFPREQDALRHVAGFIEIGIVDEAFPANGRAGFFKINPHDDEVAVGDFAGEHGKAAGVFERGGRVVDRAGADDHKHTVILAAQDRFGLAAGFFDQRELGFPGGKLLLDLRGRDQAGNSHHTQIVHGMRLF